ncbi:MAG: DegT/DnrJ/EryC1/StrS family aminotransferase [Chloroflexi bacterium]|nr:DegT/DnrJ/EryC1/StrS family aminotransferase [Chloroflexota bacterium]
MSFNDLIAQPLAINGGPKAVTGTPPSELFHWPIVTDEDISAVTDVLRAGTMSATDITRQFESEFAAWQGTEFALAHNNGTAALLSAMFGVGIGRGDEIIAPSLTYWASALPAFNLGASVVFADILPNTICIDPADIEHRITARTKAIVVVHYCGYPCDMDAIMAIAARHNLAVIEDVSHAHGARYKGVQVGKIGHVSAMSMMSGKSFPAGEAGVLCTNERAIYERAIAFGHYERHGDSLTLPELVALRGLPLGGFKQRIIQTASAMARVQLRHYDERMGEIQCALNRFWDLLEGTPGLVAHRPPKDSGSTMGGWYNPVGIYQPEALGGLPLSRFIEAVNAEGGICGRGINAPLHLHPVFNEADIYGDGVPTRNAFADRDLRQPAGSLPVAETIGERTLGIPYFKHDWAEWIEPYAAAFRKVATQASQLL